MKSCPCHPGIVLSLAIALASSCSSTARKIDAEQLASLHAQATADQHAVREGIVESITRRLQAKLEAAAPGERATIDFLVLSGGGEYGAFGAGLLKGWSQVEDPDLGLPSFDVVTGISTGSLIAPFAFLGDQHSLDEVVELYEQVDDDWAVVKATLFFWPWREAFYDRSALDAYIDSRVDQAMITRLAAAGREHRRLLVASTNIDLGRVHVWDLTQIAEGLGQSEDRWPLHRTLIASSAIPGAFPPVEIDGMLHVDGAIRGNLFLAPDPHLLPDVLGEVERRGGDVARLRLRVWVIVNGPLYGSPSLVEDAWPKLVVESLHLLIGATTLGALRLSQEVVEFLNEQHPGSAEFRFVCLPPDAPKPPKGRLFDREYMTSLAILGERIGSDPACWRTDVDPPHADPPHAAPPQE